MVASGYVHRATTYVCVGLMLIASSAAPGCDPPTGGGSGFDGNQNDSGGSSTDEPISLSKGLAKTGEFVTIEHPSIVAGEVRTISLRQEDGVVQDHEVFAHADGELSFPVPVYVETEFDGAVGGTFGVSLDGVSGEEQLISSGPYLLTQIPAGAILPLIIQSVIDDYDELAVRLGIATGELAAAGNRVELLDAVILHRDYLAGLLDELETSGGISVPVSETESVFLEGLDLRNVERHLVSMLVGAHEEMIRRSDNGALRTLGANCISELRSGTITTSQLEQCMEDCISDIKASAVRASQTAGVLPALIGGAITLVGLGASSGALVTTGLIVGVGGVIHGFVTAFAANENTDSFGSRDGQGFSSSQEILSQGSRLSVGILSNAPGPVGAAFGGASVVIAANDTSNSIEAARCDDSPRRVVQVNAEDIEFCTIVQTGGGADDGSTGGDDSSGEPDSDNGSCANLSDQFCCTGDEFCDSFLSDCAVDLDCARCAADGFCIEIGCDQPDPDCPADNGNDNGDNGNDNGANGNDNGSVDPPVVIGQPTMAICPSGFVIDVGVFDPALINLVLDDFSGADSADSVSAQCLYVRQDGGTGSWALSISYGESSGACDDANNTPTVLDGFVLLSTERTVQVVEVFSAGSRLIDRLDVLGDFIDNAVAAGVGAPCP